MADGPNTIPYRSADADADASLSVDHVKHDLRRRSVRGGAVTLAAQGARFALTMGSTAVLGRLLLPDDFGLLGQIFAITGFVEIFRDFGLSSATVQSKTLNQRQVSTLFWINGALGLSMTLIAWALAPAVAWFYGDPRLIPLMMCLSCGFTLSGFNVQHNALLRRSMRFTAIARVDVASMVCSIAAAIVAAWLNFGYWALVVQQMTRSLTLAIGTWSISGWRPGRPSRDSDVGRLLRFGGNAAGSESVIFVSRNVDKILIGKFFGTAQLGLYMKAYQLLLLPIQQINGPISQVAVPALSRLQDDPVRYRNYYRKALVWVVGLGMPIVTFMFVTADDLIATVLGPRWGEAVPLFRVLAPAAFMGTFNVATGWVYTSLGQPGRQLRWSMFTSTLTIAAYFVGKQWGTMGVAAAFSIVYCCVTMGPPHFIYCYRKSPLRFADIAGALWRPATAAVGAGAVTYLAAAHVLPAHWHAAVRLVAEVTVYTIAYFATWFVLPDGWKTLTETVGVLRELKPQRKQTEAAPPHAGVASTVPNVV